MRISHFEHLQPVCPSCLRHGDYNRLQIKQVEEKNQSHIINGMLQCSFATCSAHYPIIDALPILIHPLEDYLRNHWHSINSRQDLCLAHEAMIGEASGPGSQFNQQRHYLSTYVSSHYDDHDTHPDNESNPSFEKVLKQAFELFPAKDTQTIAKQNVILDAGCATGRSSFELAKRFDGMTLGVDLNFSLMRFAQRLLINGNASYPRKQNGLIYQQRHIKFNSPASDKVDFWIADASSLPVPRSSFTICGAFNILDAVHSPRHFIGSLAKSLKYGGQLILSTPYDWSSTTPQGNWLGGHGQYNENLDDSPGLLRALLNQENFDIMQEKENVDWQLRLHERQFNHYRLHLVAATLRG